MRFLDLVWNNLAKRALPSLLTAAGIALAVAFGVSTIDMARGFRKKFIEGYASQGTHMIVSKVSRDSPLPKVFDVSVGSEIAKMEAVEAVSGMFWDLMSIDGAPSRVVFGSEKDTFRWQFLKLVEGKIEADRADVAYLGILTAAALNKSTGDAISIESRTFRVAGIYEKSSPIDNNAVILPLEAMQEVLGQPGKINFLNIRLRPDTTPEVFEDLRMRIQKRFRGLRACRADELFNESVGAQAAMAMSLGVSALSLAIGTLGVMNSVLMSVAERKREIGLLMAVGWRRGRIVALILSEAVVLSSLGGLAGAVFGLAAVEGLARFGPLRGKIQGDFSLDLILGALAIAAAFGLIGGLLPSLRAAGLQPADTMRDGG